MINIIFSLICSNLYTEYQKCNIYGQKIPCSLCVSSKVCWPSVSIPKCPKAEMLSVEPGLRCRLPCFPFHSLKRHLRSYIGIEGQLSCTSHTSGHAPHPFSGVSSVGKPVPHVLCSQTTCPWGLFPRESCESKLLALGGPLLSRSPYLIHPPLLVLAYLRMSFSLVQTTAFPVSSMYLWVCQPN